MQVDCCSVCRGSGWKGGGGWLDHTVTATNASLFVMDKRVVDLFVTFAVGNNLLILLSEHRWC